MTGVWHWFWCWPFVLLQDIFLVCLWPNTAFGLCVLEWLFLDNTLLETCIVWSSLDFVLITFLCNLFVLLIVLSALLVSRCVTITWHSCRGRVDAVGCNWFWAYVPTVLNWLGRNDTRLKGKALLLIVNYRTTLKSISVPCCCFDVLIWAANLDMCSPSIRCPISKSHGVHLWLPSSSTEIVFLKSDWFPSAACTTNPTVIKRFNPDRAWSQWKVLYVTGV